MNMPFHLLIDIGACDSYIDSYMILFIFVSLLILNHDHCVNYISLREYHRYSLTINKSLS